MHIHWIVAIAAEKTRPLRQRALAIVDRFLNSTTPRSANAVIPVIVGGIHPLSGFWLPADHQGSGGLASGSFGSCKSLSNERWYTHRDEPVLLLQLRDVLWNRCEYDPDELCAKNATA